MRQDLSAQYPDLLSPECMPTFFVTNQPCLVAVSHNGESPQPPQLALATLLQSAQAAATPTATPSVSPSVSRTASPLSDAPPAAPAASAEGGGTPQPAEAPPDQQ
jgi:hypothetical protein